MAFYITNNRLYSFRLVYDLSTIDSIERILQNINIPRQKYFISVVQNPDGTHASGGEVYYRTQNYLIEYVKKLYKVKIFAIIYLYWYYFFLREVKY